MNAINNYFAAQRLVKNLQNLSRNQADIEAYLPLLKVMLHHLPLKAISLDNPVFYRARLNQDSRLFENIREVGYVPREMVATKGRLNGVNESILYAALCELGCLIESRTNIGKLFTIARIEPVQTSAVFFFPVGVRGRNFSIEGETKAHALFVDWLHGELSKEVGSADGYNSTIALARFFLHKEIANYDGEKYTGLVYPSVPGRKMSNTTTYNVAMRPDVFDRNYKITGVEVCCLINEVDRYCLHVLNRGQVQGDGAIVWMFNNDEMIKRALLGLEVGENTSAHLATEMQRHFNAS